MPLASKFLPVPAIYAVTEASSINRADMVARISRSWASEWTAREATFINAAGFPGNSRLPTSQSRAFLIEPADAMSIFR